MKTGRPSSRPRPPFGARLHLLRETAGLTQAQVAEKLGISPRAYAFWEREPVALKVEQLAMLADILGISADQLLGREVPKPSSGPVGKARKVFEEVSALPRRQQDKIIGVVEALVAGASKAA